MKSAVVVCSKCLVFGGTYICMEKMDKWQSGTRGAKPVHGILEYFFCNFFICMVIIYRVTYVSIYLFKNNCKEIINNKKYMVQ